LFILDIGSMFKWKKVYYRCIYLNLSRSLSLFLSTMPHLFWTVLLLSDAKGTKYFLSDTFWYWWLFGETVSPLGRAGSKLGPTLWHKKGRHPFDEYVFLTGRRQKEVPHHHYFIEKLETPFFSQIQSMCKSLELLAEIYILSPK
jgi:hypothetical protein